MTYLFQNIWERHIGMLCVFKKNTML